MTTVKEIQDGGFGTPWYQNFWPWFIVVLLGLSIIGSLVTVAIAYRHRDIDVRAPAPEAAASDARPRALSG